MGECGQTADSCSTAGLERVNSKLSEWSGTLSDPDKKALLAHLAPRQAAESSAAPSDDDFAVEDDSSEPGAPPVVPQNSAKGSAYSSLGASRAMSRLRATPDLSHDALSADGDGDALARHGKVLSAWADASCPSPRMLDYETHLQSDSLRAARRGGRKFSNMDDGEIRFRDHRDSVAMAKERLGTSQHAVLHPWGMVRR